MGVCFLKGVMCIGVGGLPRTSLGERLPRL